MTNLLPDIPWFVYAMLLAPVGLIVFAAIYKYFEVRAASDWPSVLGKVVVSKSETRKVKVIDGDRQVGHRFEERNFANVIYEYVIAGQIYRNNRISIGEDRGNFEVAETLARYPIGKAVTVYYNPNRRGEAVLERDMPKGLWGCLGWMVVIAVVCVFGAAIGFHKLTDLVTGKLPYPVKSAMTVALGVFGTAVALFALALHRRVAMARKWPVVQGRITATELEQFRARLDDGQTRGSLVYKSKQSYNYRYENIDYTGIAAGLGGQVTSTSARAAQMLAPNYREGEAVNVYVNPANPSESVLEPRVAGLWILWLVAAVMWMLAHYVATKG